MKNFILILVVSAFLFSCSSSKKNTKTNSNIEQTTGSTSPGNIDGSSFQNAIVINEKTETVGVNKEYEWLKKNYPGYSLISQSLTYNSGKPYDILKIKTAEGNTKSVYFDISKFFGKF